MSILSKITNNYLLAIMFGALLSVSACRSPEQKVDTAAVNLTEAKDDLSKAQEDYAAEVEKFKRESNEKVTSNEKIIADLKVKMKNENKEMKASYRENINTLEEKNATLKKRIDEYQDGGNEKWQSFKTEFNHDMDELGKSLKDFTVDNK